MLVMGINRHTIQETDGFHAAIQYPPCFGVQYILQLCHESRMNRNIYTDLIL